MAPAIVVLLPVFIAGVILPAAAASPYISPSLFRRDYDLMLRTLKVYAYDPVHNATSSPFHRALLAGPFLTPDPSAAHLFYLTSPHDNPRHLARAVRAARTRHSFWNRSLGSDHFFLTGSPLLPGSDRNLLELAKNSIRISPAGNSCFPHKDLVLPPPLPPAPRGRPRPSDAPRYLAFYNGAGTPPAAAVLGGLRGDPEVLVETGRRLDPAERAEAMRRSRFCLFFGGEEASIGEALWAGCVPVVAAAQAPVWLPFGDVLRWGEIAVVVGTAGGAEAMRAAMEAVGEERHRRMREMGLEAAEHFRWSAEGEEHVKVDVFRTLMYQLWLRRHVVRYSAWEVTAH